MRPEFLLVFLIAHILCKHEEGPPADSGLYNEYQYYYDVHINETTKSLLDLDPEISIILALYISGNLIVSQRELTEFFKNIDSFMNGIRISNTNLENLSFLKPFIVDELDDSTFSIEISNNPNLTRIGIDFTECTNCWGSIAIINNTKLDLKDECDNIIDHYATNRDITGNFNDCGCTIKGQFNKYIQTMPSNCYWLVGNVSIDQNSDYNLVRQKMANITRISGGLTITKTNFTDLTFLKNLQKIEVNAYKTSSLPSVTITGNSELTSLGMRPVRDGLYLTIRDNPKLCVLPEELEALFQGLSLDSNMDINICVENSTAKGFCEIPDSGALKDFPDDCTTLLGDLVVNADYDYTNGYKLYNVALIYGSLNISNSPIRNANMLFNLERIRSVRDNVAPLTISGNSKMTKFLSSFTFKGMESGVAAVIENNKNLMVSQALCQFFDTRKSAIVKNNLSNCEFNNKTAEYDRTPLNVDVYYGLPKYMQVIQSEPNSGDPQSQPEANNNGTEISNEEEGSGEEDSSGNFPNPITFTLLLLIIQLFYHYLQL
ncbi:unnamed protein product [Caenorhabditis sp. 36 PRJEB53466]|nr:unnamed protein product [Caenorhabditis sp. 36 PRJEB53466]